MSNRLPSSDNSPEGLAYSKALFRLLKKDRINIYIDIQGKLFGASKEKNKDVLALVREEISSQGLPPQGLPPIPKPTDDYKPWHQDKIDYNSILPPEEEKGNNE